MPGALYFLCPGLYNIGRCRHCLLRWARVIAHTYRSMLAFSSFGLSDLPSARLTYSSYVVASIVGVGIVKYETCYHENRKVDKYNFTGLYKSKMLRFQALKWCITCYNCWIFCPPKINISLENFFVFYWFWTCLKAYISLRVLATLSGFRGSRSHIFHIAHFGPK